MADESHHLLDRRRLALIIGIVAAVVAVRLLLGLKGYDGAFAVWNVPGLRVPFLDLRFFSGSAESLRQGFDPAVNNPFDPRRRIFNYPNIWYALVTSGITDSWIDPIAVGMIALFLGTVVIFPGRLSWLATALILLALISSAAMLGYARANVELFIFSLMVISLLLAEGAPVAAFAVMAFSILLKIIPVLGLGGFIGRNRTWSLRLMLGAIGFTIAYFLASLKDMLFMFNTYQRGFVAAYGTGVVPAIMDAIVRDHILNAGPTLLYKINSRLDRVFLAVPALPVILAALVLAAFVYLGLRHRRPTDAADTRNLRAFWMGAGVFVGTYFISTNWNYRLIFLILTLPQLAEWAFSRQRGTRSWAIVSLVMLFVSMWYAGFTAAVARSMPLGTYLAIVLIAAANWCLFASLIYLVSASLPVWLFENPRALIGHLLSRRAGSSVVNEAAGPMS